MLFIYYYKFFIFKACRHDSPIDNPIGERIKRLIKTFDLPEDAELESENTNTNNNNHSKQNRSTSSSPIPNNSQEKSQQNHSDSNESSELKFN